MHLRKIVKLVIPATLIAAALVMPGVAGAHTEVSDSSPKDGELIEAAPAEVWVKFGSTPFSIAGGSLEVLDACGSPVQMGETSMNQTQDTLTVASTGDPAGRYEIHWFAEAIDGAAQSGYLDFEVTSGDPCAQVVRDDPADDVDLGLDALQVVAKEANGKAVVKVTMTKTVRCKALKKDALELAFDVDGDDISDLFATSTCKMGKAKFTLTEPGEGEEDDVVVGSAKGVLKGTSVTVKVPASLLGDHADVFARTLFDDEDACAESICSDRAPDLGVLRAF